MAYNKSLNPVNGTGSQTISALKEQVHTARYGSLNHTHTDSITTDNSGQISTTFEIPSGAATSVYMDFATGTTYDTEYGLMIYITANGVDHVGLNVSAITDISGLMITASNGAIMIYRINAGNEVYVDIVNPILGDFTGFGDIQAEVQLSYTSTATGQVFSMTSHYN